MKPGLFLYLHTYSLRFHLQHKPGFDVFAFIDRAAAEGFAGVCISANDPRYRHLGGCNPERLARIADHIVKSGLRCDMDTSGTDPQHLVTLLNLARSIGAQQLRTYTRYQGPPAALVARTIKDLRQVAPMVAEFGIRILLENHETFTGPEIAQILSAVDDPWVGALFDYGNSQMVMEDPMDALVDMAPLAMSAHIKDHVLLSADDSPDGRLSVLGVPIGEGFLPIVALTEGLLKAGCDRFVFESSWGYRAPVKPERMTPQKADQIGKGTFRFATPPLTNERYLIRPEELPAERLVELEDQAHHRSLAWLKAALAPIARLVH